MNQQLQVQLIQAIKEDLSSPILRFYLQEEAFPCDSKAPQSLFQLPFNQITAEVVAEVTLSNKQITNNSRVAANLLENGKQILRNKKLEYFNNFKAEYKQIGEALQSLSIQQRSVIQYSVVAISNLILKLSLNMSRISIILISKLSIVPTINTFITAILFQKYLEKQHLKTKQGTRRPEDHLHLLKQLPKISNIKISQKRNPFDRHYISKSQELFGTEANNIQFIQIYQREGQFDIFFQNQDKKDSYNMKDLFGLSLPFGMELYLFFSQIVLPKIQNYKPDIVIYHEDLPCETELGINPEIKGLLINIISQKIQNKIYIFKQLAISPDSPLVFKPSTEIQRTDLTINKDKNSSLFTTYDQEIKSHQKHSFSDINIKEIIIKNSIRMNQINRMVTEARKAEINSKKMAGLFNVKKTTSEIEICIKKMRKILFDDLSYMSLALLQKQSFQNINNTFRNYTFPSAFLQNFINWIKVKIEELSKAKTFSDDIVAFQRKLSMLEGMLQISQNFSEQTTNSQKKTMSFYNLKMKKVQLLEQQKINELIAIYVDKYDQIYFHYTNTHVLLFLFSKSAKIYIKRFSEKHFVCLKEYNYIDRQKRLSAKHSTLITNNKFFYKAFGQYEVQNGQLNSCICVLDIQNIQKNKEEEWTYIEDCKHGIGRVKLQHKKWGWGTSIDRIDSNLIILGGGYNYKVQNEQRVNKFFYIISNKTEVQKIGKINPENTNLQENLKFKNFIIPCVYGIPLTYSKGELIILNTNGYFQKLNHVKKMFLTRIKVAGRDQIYILGQSKLDYNTKRAEEAIANKNTILSYMIGSYQKTNRLQGSSSLCDNQGGLHLMKLEEYQQKDNVKIQSVYCQQAKVYQIVFEKNRLIMKQDDKKLFIKKILA